MASCVVCLRLLEKTSDRRRLHSVSTKKVHSVWKEVVAGVFPNAVDAFLPVDAYLCRPCMRLVEKLTKVKQDARYQEQELMERIKRAGEARGLSTTDEAAACVGHERGELPSANRTPEKRSHSLAALETPSPKRR